MKRKILLHFLHFYELDFNFSFLGMNLLASYIFKDKNDYLLLYSCTILSFIIIMQIRWQKHFFFHELNFNFLFLGINLLATYIFMDKNDYLSLFSCNLVSLLLLSCKYNNKSIFFNHFQLALVQPYYFKKKKTKNLINNFFCYFSLLLSHFLFYFKKKASNWRVPF